ncbi:MAG: hypothetical protein GY749_15950 [Desulfobacteraceae bacterium]|nr:hypothetical protein [Desulfobacteraceae bacterium]
MNPDDWQKLLTELGAKKNTDDLFQALLKSYSEPHRAYHTLSHVNDCLKELGRSRHLADNENEIKVAIWFHDAVCKPTASDNEEKSAQWAEKVLAEAMISHSTVRRISDLIMATKHPCKPESCDAKLLVDIDLSILGRHPDVFNDYETKIRIEYKRIPWFIYRKKRAELLKSFLNQDQIYMTKEFCDRYEEQAGKNLERSIAELLNLNIQNTNPQYSISAS